MAPRRASGKAAAAKKKGSATAGAKNSAAAAASTAAPTYPFKRKSWAGHSGAKLRGKKSHWPPLQKLLIDQAEVDDERAKTSDRKDGYVRFVDLAASTSLRPSPRLCDITGLPAPYVDPHTKLRYATARVFQYIQEDLSDFDVEAILRVRNAHSQS